MTDKTIEPSLAESRDVPEGAIDNGREFLRRIAEHYDFECEGGKLANCYEYTEAVRCFEHMAEALRSTGGVTSPDYVMVPKPALDWLLGRGPDASGKYFDHDADSIKSQRGRYWWRSEFRSMIAAAPPSPRSDDGSGLTPHSTAVSAIAYGDVVQNFQSRHAQIDDDPLVELRRRMALWATCPDADGEALKPTAQIVPFVTVGAAIVELANHRASLQRAALSEGASPESVKTSPEVGEMVERLTTWANDDVRETARDGSIEPNDIEVWARMMEEAASLLIALDAERGRLKKFEDAQREMQDSSKG